MRNSNKWMSIFVMICGAVIGSIVSELCKGVSWLDWLSYSKQIGLSLSEPLYIDLIIFQIKFGFALNLSVPTIFFIFVSFLLYRRFSH